jgi:DNA-3-methyladenine glycosylase II
MVNVPRGYNLPRMWFDKPPRQPDWKTARAHLARVDPTMKHIIRRVGPCTLAPRRDYFVVLCKSIFTQQISTRIATILYGRFSELFPRKRPTPQLVLEVLNGHTDGDLERLKRCGLSRQKRTYIADLAQHFAEGEIPTHRFGRMEDEAIIESLVRVKGVGRWTAEMFLIFVLNRTDVLPVDDLGLREAVKKAYNLPERPGAAELREIAERWRPWRTIATWYLWRSLA